MTEPAANLVRSPAGRDRAPWVLGLAGSHNGAAALYRGAELVCAVQEERVTRKKRAVLLPGRASAAVDAVLADQGLRPDDLALVVAAPLTEPMRDEHRVDRHPTLGGRPHALVSHHLAHALSAFACSGFDEACALVVDGLGSAVADLAPAERAAVLAGPRPTASSDRETASIYDVSRGLATALEKHVGAPSFEDGVVGGRLGPFSSLGLAYQQVGRFSFGSWDAAGKVMGLAPYGRPRFARELFFAIDGARLAFDDSLMGIGAEVQGRAPYPADARFHADLAASVQRALEEGLMHLVRRARSRSRSRRLVCAGGVFLNSVANELIVRSGLFDEVFVIPAAEDSGTAIGAAFHGVVSLLGPAVGRRLEADALGPLPTDHAAALALAREHGARVQRCDGGDGWDDLAERLAAGQAVGFFHGRSELGPRALGQRSILFDPRRADGKDALNRRKGREPFRPFAPAVLLDEAPGWFELAVPSESPFMLRVAAVRPERRDLIPAVTHVDGTARVQTVRADGGPLQRVLAAFRARTGVPVLLNTSFNRAGEPIVESACDAVRTALAMPLDALWLDGWLVDQLQAQGGAE
ncbi:MAG: carbamoyltransferase C-terminal domain-containing protein [Myxococcota bacterium]